MQEPKKLFIVDAFALIFRAYFATIKVPMSNTNGLPTGALLGFTNYMLRLIEQFSPTHVAVTFDSPTPTFRHEIYEQYKANREQMPEDLQVQMPYIPRIIEALGLPQLRKDGLEADDIIAHLVQEAEEKGYEVFIVSKDKDLMQLVSDKTTMLAPQSGGTYTRIDPEHVEKKMGVAPELIGDLWR